MSAKGFNKVWIDMPAGVFDADAPVTDYDALTLRDNLQHLIDSSGQYRVNTVATVGDALISHGPIADVGTPPPGALSWTFPLTMMYPEHPPNFDIRVSACLEDDTDDDATVIAMVTATDYHHDIWGAGSSVGRLYYATATVSSETPSWVIDEQFIHATNSNAYLRMLRSFTVTENSGTATARHILVRFTVAIRADSGAADFANIVGVQLREFS